MSWLVGAGLGLMLCTSMAVGAEERQKDGERPRDAERQRDGEGRVQRRPVVGTVDRIEGTALILLVGDGGREVAVPTQKETELFLDGVRVKLEDLKPGCIATVTLEQGLTKRIEARSPRVRRGDRDRGRGQ